MSNIAWLVTLVFLSAMSCVIGYVVGFRDGTDTVDYDSIDTELREKGQ